MWGAAHFRAIDAISSAFGASEIMFTGLQIDSSAIHGFEDLATRHRIPFIGLRDSTSYSLVQGRLRIPAIDTFDDLTEVF